LEWQKDFKDPRDFMETLKIDLFTDEVFVFTPMGDVINLPNGSTPIDFAYKVHTAVGNNCVGAKVDGRIVPLDYKLKNGNIVEILTSANSNGPSRDWIKMVKSSQAKNKIRQWFRREERDLNINKGKELLEKEIKRQGYQLTEMLKEDWLRIIATRLSLNNSDDLYAGLGFGSITLAQVMSRLKDFHRDHYKDIDGKPGIESGAKGYPSQDKRRTVTQGISIEGLDNIKVRFSKCCNPVPGDDIVGYITRGRGVSIHRKDCPNILNVDTPERFIEVHWDIDEKAEYPVEIQIRAVDRQGLLTEITQKITDSNLSLLSLNARTGQDKAVVINMTLEIRNIEQLKALMKKIKKVKNIIDIYRVTA
ncbi:MAG TPA: bifunctional (p)ppGpp synthetase/guanosine-3',5'-bis(diphosphate) 3'-pyrophosphohydrolase, partial [Tepidimicrobium sp.]|nr:bifunctional (p)ppGpp synthetase/guanosine-3',5'-bis(diphosphate) 3'-pyrophosphohydrolase [Tepidimicrobium sp.]